GGGAGTPPGRLVVPVGRCGCAARCGVDHFQSPVARCARMRRRPMRSSDQTNPTVQLTRIIRDVRRRWRFRRVLLGSAVALAIAVIAYAALSWFADRGGWNAETLLAAQVSF